MQDKIAAAVDHMRRLWAIWMVIITLLVIFSFPFWYVVFLVPLGVITYLGSITFTIIWLTASLNARAENNEDPELLKTLYDDLKSGKIEQGSKEMFERMQEAGVAPIGKFSDEIVGQFNSQTIYEWVEVMNQHTKKFDKFVFWGPGKSDIEGNAMLPEQDGIVFATVNGIIYAKDIR